MSSTLPPQMESYDSKFPILYITKDGKTRMWAIWVINDNIYRTDGLIGGKFKEPQERTIAGNTLRSSEEQAMLEAEKYWLSQIDKGYAPAASDKKGTEIYNHVMTQKSNNGGMNRGVKMFEKTQITAGTTSGKKDMTVKHNPMLAKKYKDHTDNGDLELTNPAKKLFTTNSPIWVQPKLDGMRGLSYILPNGDVMIESRNGKSFVELNHIKTELKCILGDLIFDGELYVHNVFRDAKGVPHSTGGPGKRELTGVERYQFLSEVCKITRSKPHPQENIVQYHVFDIWDPTKTFTERQQLLKQAFRNYKGTICKHVVSVLVTSHEEIEAQMRQLIGENNNRTGYEYEGIMIRVANSKYNDKKGYHCDDLLKYKRFQDEEWQIESAEQCQGTKQGAVVWNCCKDGKTVSAVQTGSVELAKKMYLDRKKYIGKMINIRFVEKTATGIPRFPQATAIVEDKE